LIKNAFARWVINRPIIIYYNLADFRKESKSFESAKYTIKRLIMSNLSSFFTTSAKGILKFLRKPALTYKGDWVQVFPNTVLDSWHVGEFSTASYLLTVEHNSNKKEVMHINVVARPDQASYNVYGRTSIDDELITLDASVTNSIFSLKASPTDPIFLGVKVTMLAFYGETINPLTPPLAVSTGPGYTAGTGGNTEGGGSGSTYVLPTAGVGSGGVLGGVKVDGTSITISGGVISSTAAVSRSAVSTTVSLASGASTTANVAIAKGYLLYSIQTSSAAWVTLYTSSAARTSDASRTISTDPLPGAGVVAEVITAGADLVFMSPAVAGYNAESPVTTSAYLKIYNNGGTTSAITVTLTYVVQEV